MARVGEELRAARVAAGLSLARVGHEVGLSGTHVARIERALVPAVSVRQLARVGAVVGLDVRVRTYPGADPLRDTGQLRLLDRLRVRLHPALRFRSEVVLPIEADLRAWDGWIDRLRHADGTTAGLAVEAETRLTDAQSQFRRIERKLRDAGEPFVLVVVADTRANRRALQAAASMVRELFPVPPRTALAALAEGRHPGGSAIVCL